MSRIVLGFTLHAAVVREIALRFHALFLAWIHVGQVQCCAPRAYYANGAALPNPFIL